MQGHTPNPQWAQSEKSGTDAWVRGVGPPNQREFQRKGMGCAGTAQPIQETGSPGVWTQRVTPRVGELARTTPHFFPSRHLREVEYKERFAFLSGEHATVLLWLQGSQPARQDLSCLPESEVP